MLFAKNSSNFKKNPAHKSFKFFITWPCILPSIGQNILKGQKFPWIKKENTLKVEFGKKLTALELLIQVNELEI